MQTLQLAVVNCASCERCRVESMPGYRIPFEDMNPYEFDPVRRKPGLGIHVRPSALLTKLTKSFDSDISLHYGDRTVNAKSLLDVALLDLSPGRVFSMSINGTDEEAASTQICSLIRHGFGEPLCPDFENYLIRAYASDMTVNSHDRDAAHELQGFASSLSLTGCCTYGVPNSCSILKN